jgi:hypothetical protein
VVIFSERPKLKGSRFCSEGCKEARESRTKAANLQFLRFRREMFRAFDRGDMQRFTELRAEYLRARGGP